LESKINKVQNQVESLYKIKESLNNYNDRFDQNREFEYVVENDYEDKKIYEEYFVNEDEITN
jgi:guanylate kinase